MVLIKTVSTKLIMPIVIVIAIVVGIVGYFYYVTRAPTKITLTLLTHWGDPEFVKIQQKWIEDFVKNNPNVEIKLITVDFMELRTKIISMYQAGTPPDVMHFFTAWLPEFVDAGWLDEPPQDIVSFAKENFIDSAVKAVTYKGKIWGVPTESNSYMLVYRKDHFKEVEIEPPTFEKPWTFDDFLKACEKLVKKDPVTGELKRACFGWWLGEINTGFVHPFAALLVSNGGSLVAPDMSKVTYDSKEGIEVAQLWYTIVKNGWWNPKFPVAAGLVAGNVSMFIVAPWWYWTFSPQLGPNFTDVIGVAPIPIGPSNPVGKWRTVSYHWMFGVSAQSKHKDIAWKFVRFVTEQRAGNLSYISDYFVKRGIIPSNIKDLNLVKDKLYKDPWYGPFVRALFEGYAEPIPIIPNYEKVFTPLWKNFEDMVTGKISPEEAIKSAAVESNKVLRGG